MDTSFIQPYEHKLCNTGFGLDVSGVHTHVHTCMKILNLAAKFDGL
jgi:hypothetical protein